MKNSVLFKLIRNERISEDDINGIEWNEVFQEAEHQAILITVFSIAKKYRDAIPQDIYNKWQNQYYVAVAQNVKSAIHQKDMLEIISNSATEKYPYLVFKGMASAYYWSNPEQRIFGDCDFLIDQQNQHSLEDLFERNGYQKSGEHGDHHIVFKNTAGACLEMHYQFNGVPNGNKGNRIKEKLHDVLNHYQEVFVLNQKFRMPEAEYHGLIILLHMQYHMAVEGIGLRHLMDFGYFVENTMFEPFWEDRLIPFLKEIGLFVYAQVMAKTSSIYCGTKCPCWASDVDELLCEAIIEDIMVGGNFGKKNVSRAKSGMLISDHGEKGVKQRKVLNALHTLHTTTPIKYPITKEHKILYPIFDFWRIIKYFKMVITGERPSFTKINQFANNRRELYKQLSLFE